MRALVACAAVAVVVALPGVIVAATSSSPSIHVAEYGPRTQIVAGPPPSTRLMTTSFAVQVALEEKGTSVRSHSQEPTEVEIDGTSGSNCPVKVVLQTTNTVPYTYTDSCGTREFRQGNIRIVYSPPSIGSTVRQAIASLR